MKKLAVGWAMALLCMVAWALPSVQDVDAQVKQGHYTEAESMMKEVVAAKPESAKARYLYAELLAHNRQFGLAATEVAKARELDPQIKFADPEKFRAFEQLVQREVNPPPRSGNAAATPLGSSRALSPAPAPAPEPVRSSGVPGWVWLAGLALVAWLLWRGFARSRGPAAAAATGLGAAGPGYGAPVGSGSGAPPYGTAYPPQPGMQPAPGGGWMRTGAAVAGGVAAGMLADELLHRRDLPGGNAAGNDPLAGLQNPMFGPGNDSAATELENRDIDLGTGGDWDAGGGSSDIDTGGGGGGGDDSWG